MGAFTNGIHQAATEAVNVIPQATSTWTDYDWQILGQCAFWYVVLLGIIIAGSLLMVAVGIHNINKSKG